MTIEFDTRLDQHGRSITNLEPGIAPADYQISRADITRHYGGFIKIVVKEAAESWVELQTMDNDEIKSSRTGVRNGVLKFTPFKPDVVSGTTLTRVPLEGNFKIEVTKVIHRRQESQTFVLRIEP